MADDQQDPLIEKALSKIEALNGEIDRLKVWVNQARDLHGLPPIFDDILTTSMGVTPHASHSPALRWKAGDFYGESFSGAVRRVLKARRDRGSGNAPASVDEIHDALMQGSFNFDTSGADAQKNSIRISLGKNSATFVRLPNSDLFGLTEWYGAKAKKPAARKGAAEGDTASEQPDNNEEAGAAEPTAASGINGEKDEGK